MTATDGRDVRDDELPWPPPELPPSRSKTTWRTVAVWFVLTLAALLVLAVIRVAQHAPGIGPVPVPSGRAAVVPPAPPDKRLSFAPLGDFPRATLGELAGFYRERYGVTVNVFASAPIGPGDRDAQRGQLIGENVIQSMVASHPQIAADPGAVVIGFVSGDLYIRARTDWDWAFGLRSAEGFAVVSSFRMGWPLGQADPSRVQSRLRKMVGKYIGLMYFGLSVSPDPRSLVYGNIGGVDDLDAMGEEF